MREPEPRPTLSVVVPVFNEAETLPRFFPKLVGVLEGLECSFELVFVNDGSSDRSLEILEELQAGDDRVVVVDLSRNFGHQAALTAGIDLARGEAVLTMDADLEHPPEVIPEFVRAWRAGAEVVFGVRRSAQRAGLLKKVTSQLFYRVFRWVADVPIAPDSPDFRLMDRRAAEALRSMRERARFLRGMARWVGFRQATVAFEPGVRAGGATGYSLLKMIRFGADGLLSFSKAPIRLTTFAGLGVSVAAFAYAGYALWQHLVAGQTVPGWTSMVVVLSALAGFNLLALGMVGEYVGMVYDEVKRRPIYVVRQAGRPSRAAEQPAERREDGELGRPRPDAP